MTKETQNWIAMGYIKGVFGIKGWLKIKADTEYSDSLMDYPEWRLNKNGHILSVTLEEGKIIGDELQVKFTQINNRDDAALLRGYTIEIPRESFEPTDEDEYYWADLVGMRVYNHENILLGQVHNLMQTGAHDVLIVRGEYGEKLIPFVSHYINEVDKTQRFITVDWGLDY